MREGRVEAGIMKLKSEGMVTSSTYNFLESGTRSLARSLAISVGVGAAAAEAALKQIRVCPVCECVPSDDGTEREGKKEGLQSRDGGERAPLRNGNSTLAYKCARETRYVKKSWEKFASRRVDVRGGGTGRERG